MKGDRDGGFFTRVIEHPEVRRGGSHLLVGMLIGVVSTLIDSARSAKATQLDDDE